MTINGPYPGKECPKPGCPGRLHVFKTEVRSKTRVRTFRCKCCKMVPEERQSVPLEYAPPVVSRQKVNRRTSYL